MFKKVDLNGDKLIDLNEFLWMQVPAEKCCEGAEAGVHPRPAHQRSSCSSVGSIHAATATRARGAATELDEVSLARTSVSTSLDSWMEPEDSLRSWSVRSDATRGD